MRWARADLRVKLAAAIGGGGVGLLAAPAAPGRTSLLVALAMPAAGFVLPDALLERQARRHRRRLLVALPDALDLLAIGSAAGRSPTAGFAEIAGAGSGPLADELRITVAELECGCALADALIALRERIPGSENRNSLRLDRALSTPWLTARRSAAPPVRRPAARPASRRRGARRPRCAKDPAGRRAGPGPLGPADDCRRPDRQRRRASRRLLARALLQRLLAQASADRGRRGPHRVELLGLLLVAADVAAEVAVDELEGELLRG